MESIDVKYDYAFTGAALKFHDFMRLAHHVKNTDSFDSLNGLDPNEIMRRENKRTNKREFQELVKRYSNLTMEQKYLITEVDIESQKHLSLLAICKTYRIIRDFLSEVVREKLLLMENRLEEGHYNSFLNRKKDMHPELDKFSDSTEKKARQVTWRILEEAGIINNTKEKIIIPQFLSSDVISKIKRDDPNLLKVFLMNDQELKLTI